VLPVTLDDAGSHSETRIIFNFPAMGFINWSPFPTGNLQIIRARISPMSALRSVVVYSRKGCHLCEVVKESLAKLARRGGFTWHEVDVDSDSELRHQFNDEVPVVFIDGRKAFKYRMDEQEFLRKLTAE